MALTLLTISCVLFYSTSKYFPKHGVKGVEGKEKWIRIVASTFSFLSLYFFTYSYDLSTSLVFWMVAFLTLLSSIILSIKMNVRWIWVWGSLCVFFILIDFI